MQPRVYRYRKFVRFGQYALPVVFGFAIAMFIYLSFMLTRFEIHPVDMPTRILLAIVPVLAGIVGWIVWRMYYRLAGISVSVDGGTLVCVTRSGESRISLESIAPLEFAHSKYVGGWLKINAPSESIRLMVTIEGINNLVLELKEALDAAGSSELYDRKQLFNFLATATYADQSWVRVERVFWKLTLAMVLCVVLWFVCGMVADPTGLWVVPALVFAFFPALVHMGAEIVMGRKFHQATDEGTFFCPGPDIEMENRVYRKATMIGVSIYFAVLVIILVFSIWG